MTTEIEGVSNDVDEERSVPDERSNEENSTNRVHVRLSEADLQAFKGGWKNACEEKDGQLK